MKDMKNANIRLIADHGAPSRLLQEHSPARVHLAKLINDRLSIEARLRDLADAGAKLQEAADAERHAAAALNGLDAEEATAMAAWAQNSNGPMPVFDQARRQKLRAAVDAAAAQASAARKAAAANGTQQERELGTLKRVEAQIALAIVPVIVEAVDPLLADFEEANRALASKAARISGAAEVITQIGHSIGNLEMARPAFVELEKLSDRIRIAFARPAPAISDNAWLALAAALKRDPIAELKD
jgi:hypothetical protein